MSRKLIKFILEERLNGLGLIESSEASLTGLAETIVEGCKQGKMSLWFGNGGSAAQAEHFVGEFLGGYSIKGESGIPAIALTGNSSVVTAIGNDYGFQHIFDTQVRAYANVSNLAVGISTSGGSENIYLGLKEAKTLGLKVGYFTGQKRPGKFQSELLKLADYTVAVPHTETGDIQDLHSKVLHTLAEIAESLIYSTPLREKWIARKSFKG